jgi:hypothetical protein
MKKIFMLLASVLIAMGTQAQTIEIHKKDGSVRIYAAKNVDRIGFSEENIIPSDLKAVDLGLPSRTRWANMNVGAFAPQQGGHYFAWGESVGVDEMNEGGRSFWWNDYKALEKQDDGAKATWGNRWRLPSRYHFDELRDYCDVEWTELKGVQGFKFTSKVNGNSIFLPVTGYFMGNNLMQRGGGYYWSASPSDSQTAVSLNFENGYFVAGDNERCLGFAIRPVLAN